MVDTVSQTPDLRSEARQFMTKVRKSADGKIRLGGFFRAKFSALDEVEKKGTDLAVQKLCARFEGFCDFCKHPIPEHLHSAIHALLAEELHGNANRLGAAPEGLILATVYHGDWNEYAPASSICNSPIGKEVMHWAMMRNPGNPQAYIARWNEVLSNPEFAPILTMPWLVRSGDHNGNPTNFAREFIGHFEQLKTDSEFAEFRHMPEIFSRVLTTAPNAPKVRLREIKNTIQSLKNSEEFSPLLATPDVFIEAFLEPGNYRTYLRHYMAEHHMAGSASEKISRSTSATLTL